MNRVSSARIAREEGGRAAAFPRSRGVILPPRVRARSRGLSTGARGGRARSRVSGKHPANRRIGNGQRRTFDGGCRAAGATHLSPCPSFHESLNPPAATLRSTRDMTWNGGSAASASDVLAMAPALFSTIVHAFSPDSPRVPRPPGVRLIARGRALRPAGPCPTVRSAVRRAREYGAVSTAAPGLVES